MSDLHPKARDLLARAAHGHDPTDDDRTRSRTAIAARLAVGGAVATAAVATSVTKAAAASTAPPAIGAGAGAAAGATGVAASGVGAAGVAASGAGVAGVATTSGIGAGLAVKIMASVLVVGSVSVGAVEVHRARVAPAPQTTVPVTSKATSNVVSNATPPSVKAAPAVAEPSATPETPAALPVESLPIAKPAARPSAPATITTPAPSASSVQDEAALLARAQEALSEGNGSQALTILDEHARRFPNGALVEERDAARAITLCAVGRTPEGLAAADRFFDAYPRSPQRDRVRSACKSAP